MDWWTGGWCVHIFICQHCRRFSTSFFFLLLFSPVFIFPLHIGKCEVNSSEIVVFGWLAAMVVVGVRTSMDRVVVHIV